MTSSTMVVLPEYVKVESALGILSSLATTTLTSKVVIACVFEIGLDIRDDEPHCEHRLYWGWKPAINIPQ